MYLMMELPFSMQPQKQNFSKLNHDKRCNESTGSINGQEMQN